MLYLDRNLNYHVIKSAFSPNVPLLMECWRELESLLSNSTELVLDAQKESLLRLIAKYANVDFELLTKETESVLVAIASVNFPEQKPTESKEEGEKVTIEEYHQQLLVGLVNAELASDLSMARKIAFEVPHQELKGYLEARIKFLNRDAIATEKKKQKEDEQVKKLLNEIADGSFYDGAEAAMLAQ